MDNPTPTARAIIQHFTDNGNAPASYFDLMPLAGNGVLAPTLTKLLEGGVLETVQNERKTMMLVRLKQ